MTLLPCSCGWLERVVEGQLVFESIYDLEVGLEQ